MDQTAILKVGVDSRPAEEGSRRVTRSLEDIRAKARQTAEQFPRMARQGQDAFSRLSQGLRDFGGNLQQIGGRLTAFVTTALVGLGVGAVRSATSLDSLRRGLIAVTGSADEAERQIRDLRDIAKLPSVDFNTAAQASIVFQSLGKDAAFAERAIRGVANAATLSSTGQEGFEGVLRQLRQVAAVGKLRGEELTVILESAPAMAKAIQAAFGTVSAEEIQKMGLTADQFFERLFLGMETLPQATGGAAVSFENFRGAVSQLASTIGDRLLPIVVPVTDRISALAEKAAQADPALVTMGVGIAAAAAALGPLVWGTGKLVSGMAGALTAMKGLAVFMAGPWGIAAAAVIAGIIAIQQNWFGVGDAARQAWAKIVEITEAVLPALTTAARGWFNYQIGLWVGYSRAAGVAFEEVSTFYGQMVERMRPYTQEMVESLGGAIGETWDALKRSFTKAGEVYGNLLGMSRDAIAEAAGSSEASVARSGARIADAFLSGFETDYAQGLQDRVLDAFTRIRALLAAQVSGDASSLINIQDILDQLLATMPGVTENDKRTTQPGISDSVRKAMDQLQNLKELLRVTEGVRSSEEEFERSQRAAERMADEMERARNAFRDTVRLADSLSDVLGRMGLGRLSNAARGVGDLIHSAGEMRNLFGKGMTGVPSTTQLAATALPLIASAISVGSALFGGLFGGNKEHQDLLRGNNEALERMRQSLDAAANTFGRQGDVLRVLSGMRGIERSRWANPLGAFARAGISKDQLEALAQSVGITLFDSKGRLVAGTLTQLEDRLRMSSLSVEKFGETLDGQRRLMDVRRDIFDIEDPGAVLQDQYELLLRGLSEAAEIQYGLVGLDLSTGAGRRALEDGLRGLFEAFAGGDLDALRDLTGFSTVDEFLQALLGADNALDRMADAANKASNAVTDIPKAINLALYRSRITGGAGTPGGPNILPPEGPARPHGLGTGPISVHIEKLVNEAGDSPEDLARKMEVGVRRIVAAGGQVVLPVTVTP